MYYCKRCGNPITEFDVNYGKRATKNFDINNCSCGKCQEEYHKSLMKKGQNEKQKEKENYIKYMAIEMNAHIWIAVLVTLYSIIYVIAERFFNMSFDDIIFAFFVIAILVIINIIRILKTWYKRDYVEEYVSGTHFETTLKSNGTFVTKEVTDYGGGGVNLAGSLTIMFFLFPIWWLPRFLYSLLYMIVHRISHKGKNKSEEFDEEAYEIAKKETPFYKWEVDLSFPYVMVNGNKYILANQRYPADFLMRKKAQGDIEYLAIYGGYKVYDCNWIDSIDSEEWLGGNYSWLQSQLKSKLPVYEKKLLSDDSSSIETKNKI